jgi:hypothetical protein
MMGVCEQCVHFRRVRPPSQLLAAAVVSNDAPIANALAKIVEEEQKLREAEASLKTAQETAGSQLWPSRPVMFAHCGLHERDGEYAIAELKNLGGQCQDFKPGRPQRRACSDCRHRVVASGLARDQRREETLIALHTRSTLSRTSTAAPESLLSKYREGAAGRKSFEVTGAYSANGRLAVEPEYIDWCRALSGPDDFALCALVNPHSVCAYWELGDASTAESDLAEDAELARQVKAQDKLLAAQALTNINQLQQQRYTAIVQNFKP